MLRCWRRQSFVARVKSREFGRQRRVLESVDAADPGVQALLAHGARAEVVAAHPASAFAQGRSLSVAYAAARGGGGVGRDRQCRREWRRLHLRTSADVIDRETVGWGKSGSVSVDLGGRRHKTKK